MKPEIAAGSTADPGFVRILNSLVQGVISRLAPEEFWIIQIDNWFDHKWLGFSGMGAVASNIPIDRYDTVKAESYQERLRFPPFTPSRVVSQCSYLRVGDIYRESALPLLPHSTERKHSEMNLRRRVRDFSRSACFVWYSGNSATNGRASVMVYEIAGDRTESWFAAFTRQSEWILHATKGVSPDEIAQLLELS